MPYILCEREVDADITVLERAWCQLETFAFVAEKSGVSRDWIATRLAQLPTEYHKGHFALLTSGSTGKPKLVVGRRDRAERLAALLHQLQEAEPVRETVLALPLTYCYAFVNQWLWARLHRRRLIPTSGLAQPDRLRSALAAARDAMICLVGAQVAFLLEYFGRESFPGVIRLHFAGGRFPQEHLADLQRLFPSAIVFNNYGCAEAMPRLTLRRADAADEAHHIGWTLPGVEIRADAESRLEFRSPYGAVALLDDDGILRVDSETWIPTGDLGVQAPDGHWELLGRDGEVFKRYGEKISLPQILSHVRTLWQGQAEAYRETDTRGEAGYVLVLVPHPKEGQVRELLRELARNLPRPHWPLRVISLPALPLLTNGKVDRVHLPNAAGAVLQWKQHL